MRSFSTEERRRRLGRRHFLAEPAGSIEEAADGLIGLHSSDPASVFIGALARRPAMRVADMETALYDRHSLLKVLGMRRTMFAVTPKTGTIVDAACTRALSAVQHRRLVNQLAAGDVVPDPSEWIERMGDRVIEELAANGKATTRELVRRLPELDIRFTLGEGRWATEVGIASRLLFLLATDARIVRARPLGSWLSSQYRWEVPETPAEELGRVEPDDALGQLVDRWLRAYGPGTIEDLVWWTGLTKRSVMAALDDVGAMEVELEDARGWVAPDDLDDSPRPNDWVALLPALDSTVMGWRRRDWYLHPSTVPQLFDQNGNAGPTVWANGWVVGGWGQQRDGTVSVALLQPVDRTTARRIDERSEQLTSWFGGTVVTPRFPTPLWKELAAA